MDASFWALDSVHMSEVTGRQLQRRDYIEHHINNFPCSGNPELRAPERERVDVEQLEAGPSMKESKLGAPFP